MRIARAIGSFLVAAMVVLSVVPMVHAASVTYGPPFVKIFEYVDGTMLGGRGNRISQPEDNLHYVYPVSSDTNVYSARMFIRASSILSVQIVVAKEVSLTSSRSIKPEAEVRIKAHLYTFWPGWGGYAKLTFVIGVRAKGTYGWYILKDWVAHEYYISGYGYRNFNYETLRLAGSYLWLNKGTYQIYVSVYAEAFMGGLCWGSHSPWDSAAVYYDWIGWSSSSSR